MKSPETSYPPRSADRLLAWFCAPHLLEEVQGDLHERYGRDVQMAGVRTANWRYWLNVLRFIRPFAIKRKQSEYSSPFLLNPDMLRNYLKIALRQLWQNRLFSLLNITGLTVGLAVSTFIALYVWHEFHYDRFQPFADRTYRILGTTKFGSDEVYMTGMHESFGREIKRQLPEVEEVVRVSQGAGQVILQSDPQHQFKEVAVGYADASILPTMGYSLLNGVDPKTALSEPGRIVITRELARKYFGTENAVGKTLLYDRQYPLTVSGVLNNYPTNSYFQFHALISLSSMPTLGNNPKSMFEGGGFLETFLVFRPDANVAITEKKLKKVSQNVNVSFKDDKATYTLEVISSLHLVGRGRNSTKQTLYVFLSIAMAILALAIINYVSLTTARATQRAREVGIRKAVGGLRWELIGQFFTESFLFTTLAFGLSVGLLYVLFPWTKTALKVPISADVLNQSAYWGVMLGLWLVCALLAGSYPALLLSGFRPQDVLKSSGIPGTLRGATGVRRLLTTIQFTVSIGLLICSLVIYAQMRYLQVKQIGIDRAQVVALSIDRSMAPRFAALRNDLRQWLGPDRVATTNTGLFTYHMMTYFTRTKTTKKDIMVNAITVDAGFFRTMGVRWVQAPDGWPNRSVTKDMVVYNRALIKEAGMKGPRPRQSEVFDGEIIDGIVGDFHNRSLHQAVSPMRLSVVSDTSRAVVSDGGYLLVRFDPRTNVPTAMSRLRDLYNQHQPTTPFDYYFLDDAYNELYDKEQRQARLFNGFTALTLLVACLGLLGLITFTVETRTKEIGVRKVLGASVTSIVTLLSKDFVKLILIAVVVASPVAWYAMNRWLQDFAYKIDIEWWVFALAGGLTTGIALITVSFQSVRAALMNPVESLRSE